MGVVMVAKARTFMTGFVLFFGVLIISGMILSSLGPAMYDRAYQEEHKVIKPHSEETIPETLVRIYPNDYYLFTVHIDVEGKDDLNATVYFQSDGTFHIYVFDLENLDKWKAHKSYSYYLDQNRPGPNPEIWGSVWAEESFRPKESKDYYIVFENTRDGDTHLRVRMSLAWNSEVTEYETKYRQTTDYLRVYLGYTVSIVGGVGFVFTLIYFRGGRKSA